MGLNIKKWESFKPIKYILLNKAEYHNLLKNTVYDDFIKIEIDRIVQTIRIIKPYVDIYPNLEDLKKYFKGESMITTLNNICIFGMNPKERIYITKIDDEWFLLELRKLESSNNRIFTKIYYFKCDGIEEVEVCLKENLPKIY